jgi:phenylalanine-4-hydroxylase
MPITRYEAYLPDKNGYISYTQEEHNVWNILYTRQLPIVKSRATSKYLEGLDLLGMSNTKIPQPKDISNRLKQITGWGVEPVAALINFDTFFNLLANKKFPAASFIRRKEDLDYLMEPDIFHELFGHCPLLTNQDYANFVQEVGIFGKTLQHEDQIMLGRLFWFSIEFGLINDPATKNLKIYGAGILSSKSETTYALDSDVPLRKPFNLIEVLRTPYRYDVMQKVYFIIDNLKSLYNMIDDNQLTKAFAEAKSLGMLPNLYAKAKPVNNINTDYRS